MDNFKFTEEEIESVCLELDIPVTAFSDRGSERRIIIDHWNNANIIACPGSGKTTVLLAKLLLLSRRMPFSDGSGVCVLTHTNVAIDEIKSKLGGKADILFKHPNFFGTIQGFVNKFLATPYFSQIIPNTPITVNESSYKQSVDYNLTYCLKGEKRDTFKKIKYIFLSNEKLKYNYRFSVTSENKIVLVKALNDKNIEINKPKGRTKGCNYEDYTEEEKEKIYKYLKKLKTTVMKSGNLHFDDMYFLAKRYLNKFDLSQIFEKRFSYLFVDEMQDTQHHQMDIINSAFNDNVKKQFYGDPDQAIFTGITGGEMAWDFEIERCIMLKITDSKRYSPAISECLNPFKRELADVVGKATWTSLQPCILLYDHPEEAIELFYNEIKKNNLLQEEAYINWNRESSPFNVVGFIGKKPDQGNDKITIHSYVSNYSRNTARKAMIFENLVSYFQKRPLEEIDKSGTRVYYDIFINAFIAVLALSTDKTHTKTTLVNELRSTKPIFFNEYSVEVYRWIKEIESEKKQPLEIKKEFLTLLEKYGYTTPNHKFITDDNVSSQVEFKNNSNIISKDGVNIKIGTIHSVKGETHMATLLLENENYSELESTYFFNKQSGNLFCGDKYQRPQKSYSRIEGRLKTAYVAMSRPTHLLCVAMSRDKVGCTTCVGEKKENCKWAVITKV